MKKIFSTKLCPDVIAVSETKLKDSSTFPYKLPNHTFIQANSSTDVGGAVMFIKSKHSFNRVHSYDLNTNSYEDIWIEISLKNKKKTVIGTIYHHPTNPNPNPNPIDKLSNNNITYYICDDISIDSPEINNRKISCYMNTLFSYGCNQYIHNATML